MSNFIPLSQAIEMTRRFREEKELILIPELRDMGILPICEAFDRGAFEALLAKPGCASIRTYLGMDPDLKVRLISVAVDAKGNDILPSGAGASAQTGDDIVEDGFRCPTTCPPPSPLNE